MKKYINLLNARSVQQNIPNYVFQARKYGYITLGVSLLAFIMLASGYYFLHRQSIVLAEKNAQLTQFMQSQTVFERKVSYFLYKKNLLTRYLKDDADFSKYYGIFQTIITQSELNTTINTFSVNKFRQMSVALTFEEFEDAKKFLKAVESPAFTRNFTGLKIVSFSAGSRKSINNESIPVYRMELRGIFKN